MSILNKYKDNKLWAVDFRSGTYSDLTGNISFTKTGSLDNIGLFAKSLSNLSASSVNISEAEFTVIMSVEGCRGGYPQRFLDGDILCYWQSGTFFVVLSASSINENITMADINIKKSTIALTFKDGTLNYYLDGLSIGTDTFTASNIIIDDFKINSSETDRAVNGKYLYNYAFDKALTESEVAVLTSELNTLQWDKNVYTKISEWRKAAYTDGSTSNYIRIPGIELSNSDTFEIEWSCLLDTYNAGLGRGVAGDSYCYINTSRVRLRWITTSIDFSTLIGVDGNKYTVKIIYNGNPTGSNNLTAIIKNLDTGVIETESKTVNTSGFSNAFFDALLTGIAGVVGGHTSGLTWGVKVTKNETLINYYNLSSSALDRITGIGGEWVGTEQYKPITITHVPIKGGFGAIANETTTTSGYLENLPVKVLSGSFKAISEEVSNELCKTIECISTGDLQIDFDISGLTGYKRYINGALIETDLAAEGLISLTTADKLIWSSQKGTYDLYKEN